MFAIKTIILFLCALTDFANLAILISTNVIFMYIQYNVRVYMYKNVMLHIFYQKENSQHNRNLETHCLFAKCIK